MGAALSAAFAADLVAAAFRDVRVERDTAHDLLADLLIEVGPLLSPPLVDRITRALGDH